ncbi:MAG: hypothetical protein ACRC7O_08520, partial [Fimbriiglobus sp.]
QGEALHARYARELMLLRAEISKTLPVVDRAKLAALEKARGGLKAAAAEQAKTAGNLGKISGAQALVEHAKGKWIAGADKGIAQAQDALKNAKTDAERTAATADLAKWQANKADGQKALVERQAAFDKLKADQPALAKANADATAALTRAQAAEDASSKAVIAAVNSVLASPAMDAKLVKAAVLADATPHGLAQFAQQGKDHQTLVDQLLADTALMTEMLSAGGASGGRYGRAMQITTDIQKASPRAGGGIYHRLAVATGVAHAVPIAQRNSEAEPDSASSQFVDPVKRYLHYEKAHLAGELDAEFPGMTTWECRYIVDSYAPDEMLAWGREMLRNYRPDHILNADYGWRYSGAVRTDVAYRHSNEYKDIDTLNFFQNICKNGGICGRRAFFGRYIVQAFGLPARPFTQPKHAALVRWTPKGWVVNLGAGWPVGWFPEQTGPEFLLDTQARRFPEEYKRVQRAEWVASALGEPKVTDKKTPVGPWRQLAIDAREAIVAEKKPAELAALGVDIAEANESAATKAAAVEKATITEADKKIVTGANGTITIPAAALGGGNHVVKSFQGGLQLICGTKPIVGVVDVRRAGKYQITARVVTVHGEMTLPLTVNGAKSTVDLAVPFTVGVWQATPAAEVTLTAGKNTLSFAAPAQSFGLKEIVLTPAK